MKPPAQRHNLRLRPRGICRPPAHRPVRARFLLATAIACALALLVTTFALAQPAGDSPEQLLKRGKSEYRSGHYADAVQGLQAAFSGFLTPDAKRRYVMDGQMDTLTQIEQSLVYLTLAYNKLNREADARDSVLRLIDAERIAPTYATLPLDPDAAEFEPLAARLVPATGLPHNAGLPRSGERSGRTSSQVAQTKPVPSAPPPMRPATALPPGQPAPTPSGSPQPPLTPEQRSLILQLIEERAAAQRAEIEREAAAMIADARRQADERVAAERASIEREMNVKLEMERMNARKTAAPPPASNRNAVAPAAVTAASPATAQAAGGTPGGAGTSTRDRYDEMARAFAAKPSGAYTVQFELVCETVSLSLAIQEGGDKVWFVPIVYRDRRCYRVFWGHYQTRPEAERARGEVPASLRGKSKPVVVTVPRP